MFRRWLHDRKGTTAIEYALIAAMVAIAAIAGLSLLGTGTNSMWAMVGSKISAATAGQ